MGATLPIVMRSALVEERAVASRIGLLYAINTTGAIVGALVAGFYFVGDDRHGRLVPDCGRDQRRRLALLAIAASFAPAVPAVAWASSVREARTAEPADTSEPPEPPLDSAGRACRAVDVRVVRRPVAGARNRLVPHARDLSAAHGLRVHDHAGGRARRYRARQRHRDTAPARPRPPVARGLTVVQLAIGIAAVLSLNTLAALQGSVERFGPVLTRLGLDPYVAPIIVASLLAMLPTTVCSGFAFPIGLSLWAGRRRCGAAHRHLLRRERVRRHRRLGAGRLRAAADAWQPRESRRGRVPRARLECAAGEPCSGAHGRISRDS